MCSNGVKPYSDDRRWGQNDTGLDDKWRIPNFPPDKA